MPCNEICPTSLALRTRLNRKHGKGKAMGVLTDKLGRTIYHMLLRKKPFDIDRFLAA